MDLKRHSLVLATFLSIGLVNTIQAAPRLRLDTAAVGPISIAVGSTGPTQTVNATNAGDGTLGLTATSNVTWLAPTVGSRQACGLNGTCYPITIALQTSGLARGTYTGIITVRDANAVDAPQTISVTVNAGGGVPDNLTFYAPTSGAEVKQNFSTAKLVTVNVTNPGSGATLSVAAPTVGSFASTFSYTVSAKAATTTEGAYNGSLVVSNSSVATENKTVGVTVNVTSKAILRPSALNPFRVAQGTVKQVQYIAFSNLSTAAVTLSGATATTTSGGNWLSAAVAYASVAPYYVGVTVDPTGLAPGSYAGSVTVASNAANSSITVPVQVDIVAAGPPVVYFAGVQNNGTFLPGTIAQGDLPAIFGEQLSTGDPQSAQTLPLGTTLGGATVFINDQPARIYYASSGQINFQVPWNAMVGEGTLRVDRDGQRGNTVSIKIAARAPTLLISTNQAGAVVSTASRNYLGVDTGGPVTPVRGGDVVTIWSLGFGKTPFAQNDGEATPGNVGLAPITVPGNNLVYFGVGGLFSNPVSVQPQYLGLTPGGVSLYQVNLTIPANAPKGPAVPVYVQGDAGTSNQLLFNIQ